MGAGDELQVHMELCNNGGSREAAGGVRGGAPGKFCSTLPIIRWGAPCLNIAMHPW